MEERRGEIEGGDALRLDQAQRRVGIPALLADVATADQAHREQRVVAHRVVERHHAERAVAEAIPVLERLREPSGALGAMGARHAFRAAGRPRGVEHDRGGPLVQLERARVPALANERRKVEAVVEEERGARVVDAVLEVRSRDAVRERDEDGAEPLAGPEELNRLGGVAGDRGDAISLPDPFAREAGGEPRRPLAQLRVGETIVAVNDRLDVRCALGRGQKRQRKVHSAAAASRIACTIGS